MSKKIVTISNYVVLETYRSRFFLLVFFIVVVCFLIGLFARDVSITESSTINVAFSAALLRLCVIFSIALLVVTSITKEFHDQTMNFVLATDTTRFEYYMGKFLGFTSVSAIVVFLVSICLFLISPMEQVLLWSTSMYLEILIVISFTLLCSTILNHLPIVVFAVIGFYLLSRSIDSFVLISQSPTIIENTMSEHYVASLISIISLMLPKLSAFSNTSWLVYDTGSLSALIPQFVQTVLYSSLVIFVGLIDFYRKKL